VKAILYILTLIFCVNTFGYSHTVKDSTNKVFTLIPYTFSPSVINDVLVSDSIVVRPQFPGGMFALSDYLRRKTAGPNFSIQRPPGTVFVSFIVERDGSISNAEAIRGTDFYFEWVVEIAENMPNWEPALLQGKPVRFRSLMPVRIEAR